MDIQRPVKTILVVVFLFAQHYSFSQTLSESERKFVLDFLVANSDKFLSDIEKTSEQQWGFRPAPDRWSVAEIAEHIVLSESLLFSIAQKTLLAPADEDKSKELDGQEEQLLARVSDRSSKAQAPEVLKPTGRFSTKEELLEAFKTARARTLEYASTTNDPLKTHVAPHPVFGEMTAYQWLVFIAAHADRHLAQLNEVQADGNYPKK